jgi:tetratricopeptide (TPR) repeat protein
MSKKISAETLFKEGLDFFRKDCFQDALQRWKAVESMDPEYPNISMYINVCRRREIQANGFIEALGQSVAADVDDVKVMDPVVTAKDEFEHFMSRGDTEKAETVLEVLHHERPADANALRFLVRAFYRTGAYARMIECAESLVKKEPHKAASHIVMGNAYFWLEKYQEAMKSYLMARKLSPKNPKILINLGAICVSLGQLKEARKFYRMALSVQPGNDVARSRLARLKDETQEIDDVILQTYQVMNQDNPYPDVLCKLGVLYGRKGQLDKAYDYLKRAIGLNQAYQEALLELGKVCVRLEKFEEACGYFMDVVDTSDKELRAMDNIRQFINTSYFEEAAQLLEQQLRLDTDYGAVHIELGKEYYNQGQDHKAKEELEKGVYLNPEYPDGHYYLGLCLQNEKNLSQAAVHFQEAFELNPFYYEPAFALVEILGEEGDFGRARNILQRILSCVDKRSPEEKRASEMLRQMQ